MSYDSGSGSETVAFTSDGGFIIGGYIDAEGSADEFYFKSSGQAYGIPFAAKVSAADAAGSSAPSSFEWTYSNDAEESMGSIKSIRIDSNDNAFMVMGLAGIIKLNDAGEEVWNSG